MRRHCQQWPTAHFNMRPLVWALLHSRAHLITAAWGRKAVHSSVGVAGVLTLCCLCS